MWDSVRSTWPVDGPGGDSLPLGSRDNTSVLPATFAPLWSSNLVDLSSRCPLSSIQSHLALEGCLWSLACQCILWGNKANCLRGPAVPSWNSFILWFSALVLFVCILWGLWTFSEFVQWRDTKSSSRPLLWTYLLALKTQGKTHLTRNTTHLSSGMLSSDLQRLTLLSACCLVWCDNFLSAIPCFWLLRGSEWELSHYFVTLVMKYDKNEFTLKDWDLRWLPTFLYPINIPFPR